MCKQLNGSVLKSLKTKWSGRKSEEKKMVEPGPGRNFYFYFEPWLGRKHYHTGRATPEKSGPCRPVVESLHVCEKTQD